MKKVFSRILIFILGFGFVFGTCGVTPVYAADSYSTFGGNVIDCSAYEKRPDGSDWEEGGVICILKIVLNIMSFGIGVLAVVGIVLSGIQYITSQGDPGKMAKAKNRIIQVVIGLVIYAVLYAALYFLVPGFNTDMLNGNGGSSGGGVSDPRNVRTDVSYSLNDIKNNLSSDDGTNWELKYMMNGTQNTVKINSSSDMNCTSDNTLIIRPYARGYDERKIKMNSASACNDSLTFLNGKTGAHILK